MSFPYCIFRFPTIKWGSLRFALGSLKVLASNTNYVNDWGNGGFEVCGVPSSGIINDPCFEATQQSKKSMASNYFTFFTVG